MALPDIPTPVPTSVQRRLKQWWNSGWLDRLWQLAVLVVAVTAAFALAGLGGGFVVFAFIVLYFVFQEPLSDALADVWDRDFWRL